MARVVEGRYECQNAALSQGPAGVHYRAVDRKLNRKVVVHLVRAASLRDNSTVERLLDAAKRTAAIDHPNVAKIFDFGIDDGDFFVVREAVRAQRLGDYLVAAGELTEERCLDLLRQIVDGLKSVHRRRLIHGHLSPSNVLVDQVAAGTLVVKLSEIGIEHAVSNSTLTDQQADGELDFVAPECILSPGSPPDPRMDIYSAAAIFVRAFVGLPLWRGRTAVQIIEATHEGRTPPAFAKLVPTISPALNHLVSRALERDPNARFEHIEAFERAVLAYASPSVDTLPEGFVLHGKYRIERNVGGGGLAAVYLAYDQVLRRKCALKILREVPQTADFRDRERLYREGHVELALTDDCIVRTLDAGDWRGHPFLALEYVDGVSLRAAEKTLEWEAYCGAVARVARALDSAHQAGVIHRDLSPENIIIERGGRPRLIDFGHARAAESSLTGDHPGGNFGTPGYISPEQALDPTTSTGASDQWALAAIVYESLTGQVPLTLPELALSDAEVAPPGTFNPTVDADLDATLCRALARNPQKRFATVSEFAEALTRSAAGPVHLAHHFPRR